MRRRDRSSGLLAAVLGLIALVSIGLAYDTSRADPRDAIDFCQGCGINAEPEASPSAVATP